MTSALQRPHVLIVSDDQGLTDFLGEGLVYAGFWTSAVASAMQALEVFRLRSFDVMLLDAALGGIGALELLRRLRGRSDRSAPTERTDIPILVIATTTEELSPSVAAAAGAEQVLIAPIELADLAEALWKEIAVWREQRPDRRWADEEALGRS
jgi:CheY-like chemotaxis protein